MLNFIAQLEMLLAALSALIPLIPDEHRGRANTFLNLAAKAVTIGATVTTNLDDLAAKLALVRAEVEAMAAAGASVTAAQLDGAIARVRAASKAFRAAVETAEAGPP